jgi:threonine dehydratase
MTATEAARRTIAPFVLRTPLVHVPSLSRVAGAPVHLKLESLQVTGSFKVRGAANRMAWLSDEERQRGVVTCSSGNHGRAVAFVAERMGVPATICVPEWVDPVKLEGMRGSGARIVAAAGTYDQAAEAAERLADEEGLTFVHPFDDPMVIAGQGTIGLEIVEDLPGVAHVVVPLSGGGLCGGIADALRQVRSEVRVTAVSAERARVMLASLEAGKPVELDEEETLANALSGGIGLGNAHTFALIRDLVHGHAVVTEDQIAQAMRFAARDLHVVVEGGGAVGIAAVLAGTLRWTATEGPVAIVVSGGNVEVSRLAGL